MAESYSRSETDLKLETTEQRTQVRFEQLINLISVNTQNINARFDRIEIEMRNGFKLVDKDITWLKWMLASVVLPLIGAIIAFLFSK